MKSVAFLCPRAFTAEPADRAEKHLLAQRALRLSAVKGFGRAVDRFRRQPSPVLVDELSPTIPTTSAGGMIINSGIVGTLACRILHSWSDWHGGEALGVKILEVANLPALALTACAHVLGEIAVGHLMPACRWSSVLAGVFVLAASAQWWLLGLALDHRLRRFRHSSNRGGTT